MPPLITLEQLQSICFTSQGKGRCALMLPHLLEIAPSFQIYTPVRLAAFVAQVMHESAEFCHVRELGSDAYLAKYDTGSLAARLGNTPAADGDGQKYRGRGLIQITGRANYERCAVALRLNLIDHPELLEQPINAVRSACWFWWRHGLNELADAGNWNGITKTINGGLNGINERSKYWERAKRALGVQP